MHWSRSGYGQTMAVALWPTGRARKESRDRRHRLPQAPDVRSKSLKIIFKKKKPQTTAVGTRVLYLIRVLRRHGVKRGGGRERDQKRERAISTRRRITQGTGNGRVRRAHSPRPRIARKRIREIGLARWRPIYDNNGGRPTIRRDVSRSFLCPAKSAKTIMVYCGGREERRARPTERRWA